MSRLGRARLIIGDIMTMKNHLSGAQISFDDAERLVEKARLLGASYAEARYESNVALTTILKNGNPEASVSRSSVGVSVRVLYEGALGFACTNLPDKINEIAERAVKLGKASSRLMKGQKIALAENKGEVAKYGVSQKEKWQDHGTEDLLKLLYDIDRAIPNDLDVTTRYLSAGTGEKTKYYTNSDGAKIECTIPRMRYYGAITSKYDGQSEQSSIQLGRCEGYEFFDNMCIGDRMKNEAIVLRNIMKDGVKAPTGEIDLVLGPEVVGIAVHESCGHPYEADRILGREAAQAGESFVTPDMIGQRIGTEVVTVIEDPTMPNNNGFYLYDDEGVKARPRELIKSGIINEFLQNRVTAAALGTTSNASARALDYDFEPIVRMSNTYMKPGEHVFDELFEGVKLGVYMRSFNEWNIDDLRYNQKYVGREAYIIENGRVGKPVRRPVLELSTPKFYRSIDAVAKNPEWLAATCGKGEPMQGIPVDHGGAPVRLRNIRLG